MAKCWAVMTKVKVLQSYWQSKSIAKWLTGLRGAAVSSNCVLIALWVARSALIASDTTWALHCSVQLYFCKPVEPHGHCGVALLSAILLVTPHGHCGFALFSAIIFLHTIWLWAAQCNTSVIALKRLRPTDCSFAMIHTQTKIFVIIVKEMQHGAR